MTVYDLGHIELPDDGRVPIPGELILEPGDVVTWTRTVTLTVT